MPVNLILHSQVAIARRSATTKCMLVETAFEKMKIASKVSKINRCWNT